MRMRSSRDILRVLLDTNILISYLLALPRQGIAARLFDLAATERIQLIVNAELVHELETRVRRKRYLSDRIEQSDLADLIETLSLFAEQIDTTDISPDRVVRDKNDDYLITLAIAGRVDVLVTGDRDLLDLDLPLPFRIVSMAGFLAGFGDE